MSSINTIHDALHDFALGFPEAYADHPWGETAVKVNKKVFLFLYLGAEHMSFSVKLPHSAELALTYPYVEPTGYGLGRHGWISAKIHDDVAVSLDTFKAWVDESYRAVAPKKLVKLL